MDHIDSGKSCWDPRIRSPAPGDRHNFQGDIDFDGSVSDEPKRPLSIYGIEFNSFFKAYNAFYGSSDVSRYVCYASQTFYISLNVLYLSCLDLIEFPGKS